MVENSQHQRSYAFEKLKLLCKHGFPLDAMFRKTVSYSEHVVNRVLKCPSERMEDEVDETERTRRRLLSRYLAAEGRAAITHAADAYLGEGFELPREQEVQLKLLEHFYEARAVEAVSALSSLIEEDDPIQLPILRQRLRRLEDHAEDGALRDAATELRRRLPA